MPLGLGGLAAAVGHAQGGHADGQAPVAVVDAQAHLERPDVALGPADVALGRVIGVEAADGCGAEVEGVLNLRFTNDDLRFGLSSY